MEEEARMEMEFMRVMMVKLAEDEKLHQMSM